ncbi:transcriptional regulator, ArsR family [Pseudonocardia oroxyli]|uniref:Transcriptional regulator, ArsR family n=1 Tax=Pseudonocardia oroxyli TaxID=366584 RepID=A0A1G7P6Z5_PSEOR|nr:metalloregulator ArsR/SmtB family transcription factor [Pseudonocardia oroxyli]SDF81907.1 transcriptional regulator, ArsR family [Pseudonocardia oroxyli]
MRVDLFAALADPVRREVVELLADGPVTAGVIAERFPVTRPAVSRHLRVLREAGLVEAQVRGQQRVYTLRRAGLAPLEEWLERFRAPVLPADRLDALDTELRRGRRARDTEGERRGTA